MLIILAVIYHALEKIAAEGIEPPMKLVKTDCRD